MLENFLEKKLRNVDHKHNKTEGGREKNGKTKGKDRKSNRIRLKNKTGDRKVKQNDSPGIPDRTPDTPPLSGFTYKQISSRESAYL